MAAYTYEFAGNIGFKKVSAQTVGEVCEALERSERGLSPQTLLDESRDENAPLHNAFDWDNDIAAEKWRLEQARQLIANIRIVRSTDQEEREKVRGFVSTPGRNGVYVSLHNALNKDEFRNHLLEQARRDSEIFLAKYRKIEELASVTEAMEEFLKVS